MGSRLNNFGMMAAGAVIGVAVSMQFSALAHREVEPALPIAELRQLADVYELIKAGYVDPVDGDKLMTEAINGMVGSLDPHSAYLDKAAYRALREGTQGRFVGIGIEVATTDRGNLAVISALEGSPAYRAGVREGDIIVRIGGIEVDSTAAAQAVQSLRGEAGTRVTLTVEREGIPFTFTMLLAAIVQQSVKARLVEPGYAWVRVSQFQEPTLDALVEALAALHRAEPDLKGLVLDLRNDPGGLLQGAIGVAAAFLPHGAPVVSTSGQVAEARQQYAALRDHYSLGGDDPLARLPASFKRVPMVVLVNAGSASASEIVAGALQDHKRALIMGQRTFGKGSVQTVRPLGNETAVKLTTARYYTPQGRAIQARGIEPDLQVDDTAEGNAVGVLRMRETDLERHLAGEEPLAEMVLAARHDAGDAARRGMPRFGTRDDFQLAQALRHLKGEPVALSKAPAHTASLGVFSRTQ